ncbi:MAG: methyl-accepting chemotaxis protein [Stappiaceae bacterium]
MKISAKLPAFVVSIALMCSAGVGVASYMSAASSVHNLVEEKLVSLAKSQKNAVSGYLAGIEAGLLSNAGGKTVRGALSDFKKGWAKVGDDPTIVLQKTYIEDNPHTADNRDELRKAGRSPYDRAHSKYHPVLRRYMSDNGYGDLLLADTDGNVVYSVKKNLDFGTNLISGPWKDTSLAKVFEAALNGQAGKAHILDLSPYKPLNDAPAGFIAAPIPIGKKKIGVIISTMPTDKISALLAHYDGLGSTGDVLMVNNDGLIQNESMRTTNAVDLMSADMNNETIHEGLSGRSIYTQIADFRGESVGAAIEPFQFLGRNYAVVVTQSSAEVFAPLASLRNWVLFIAVISAIAAAGIGIYFSKRLAGRLNGLSTAMGCLADGDIEVELPTDAKADEIDDMTRSVLVFRDNAVERQKLSRNQEEMRTAREQREQHVDALIDNFRTGIQEMLGAVGSNADIMQETARALNSVADETSGGANTAAAASEQASVNVQTVASAAEELSASIGEISRQVASANEIVEHAVTNANTSNEKIGNLADAAQKIGDVVSLISDIAEQTNLLALNATIEAARAGDAGKGFAVVASEVKSLATQTAKATEEIGSQISEIQGSTSEAVDAIGAIMQTMSEVNEYTASIASAVQEQGSATDEISSNVMEAARGTENVASSMVHITSQVQETSQSAGQVLSASSEVNQQAGDLRTMVDRFLKDVAAA